MAFNPAPSILVNGGSGLLLIALGVFVASVKPRRKANLAFALFSATFGLQFVAANLVAGLVGVHPLEPTLAWIEIVSFAVATVALAFVAGLFPASLAPAERRLLRAPGFGGAALFLAMAALGYLNFGNVAWPARQAVGPAVTLAFFLVNAALFSMLFVLLLLLPLRYRNSGSNTFRSQCALTSAGLAMYPSLLAGQYLLADLTHRRWMGFGMAVLILGITLLWLWNTRLPSGSRSARNLALVTLGAMLAGALLRLADSNLGITLDGAAVGATRTLMVIILAYAILRRQLLGIDLRIKWTISRGTVAGLVLAAFFLVTAVAQNFFSERWGWIYGGLATGVMLFAIHPLQRVGDRLASLALPGVRDNEEYRTVRRRELYRAAVDSALQDGTITDKERDVLATLQEHLGLGPMEALRIEREAAHAVHPSA